MRLEHTTTPSAPQGRLSDAVFPPTAPLTPRERTQLLRAYDDGFIVAPARDRLCLLWYLWCVAYRLPYVRVTGRGRQAEVLFDVAPVRSDLTPEEYGDLLKAFDAAADGGPWSVWKAGGHAVVPQEHAAWLARRILKAILLPAQQVPQGPSGGVKEGGTF